MNEAVKSSSTMTQEDIAFKRKSLLQVVLVSALMMTPIQVYAASQATSVSPTDLMFTNEFIKQALFAAPLSNMAGMVY